MLLNAEEKRNLNRTQNDWEQVAQIHHCPMSSQNPQPQLQITSNCQKFSLAPFQKPEKQSPSWTLLLPLFKHKRCLNKHCSSIFGFQSGLPPHPDVTAYVTVFVQRNTAEDPASGTLFCNPPLGCSLSKKKKKEDCFWCKTLVHFRTVAFLLAKLSPHLPYPAKRLSPNGIAGTTYPPLRC